MNSKHRRRSQNPGGLPDWAIIVLVFVITLVWLANFVVSVFNPKYQPPAQINAIFPAIVGAILLNASRQRGRAPKFPWSKGDDGSKRDDSGEDES